MSGNAGPGFVDTFACSQIGKGRSVNGDQFVVAELRRAARVHHASMAQLDDSRRFGEHQAHVLLVADGMSGEDGAKHASRLVVDEVLDSILNSVPWTPELDVDSEASLRQELRETVVRADDEITSVARRFPQRAGMASTLTMAFVRWPTAFIVHAGDSRAYLIRGGEIEQLTRDHTVAQQLVEEGQLDPDNPETTRFAKMLWNAVGGSSDVEPELTTKELRAGDVLLLCSDGLTGHLSDGAILHLVEQGESAEDVCKELVGAVSSIGGHDDCTAVLARFESEVERGAAAVDLPSRGEEADALEMPSPPARGTPPPTPAPGETGS